MNTANSAASDDTAHRYPMGKLFSMPFHWRVPIYQRHYSWGSEDAGQVSLFWETVKKQAKRQLDGEELYPHYLGAILIKENRQLKGTRLDAPGYFDIVDGQQRITTIQLALLALMEYARTDKNLHADALLELREYVFVNNNLSTPRLLPCNYDKKQYRQVLFAVTEEVVDLGTLAGEDKAFAESKVFATFKFFLDKYKILIASYAANNVDSTKKVFDALRQTLLKHIDVVLIQLRDTDKAQEVFESLNTSGKPLTTLDLIRNNVFQRAAEMQTNGDQAIFDSKEWQTFEDPFWETSPEKRRKETHVEIYIPRMMIAKLPGKTIKFSRNLVVKAYREEFAPEFGNENILAEVRELIDYADLYRDLTEREPHYALPTIDSGGIKSFGVFALQVWGNRDFFPVVFLIAKSQLPDGEKQRMLRLLESFVVRRRATNLSSENYNILVPEMCEKLAASLSYGTLKAFLIRQEAEARRFPEDNDINTDRSGINFFGSSNSRKISNYILQIVARDIEPADPESEPINKLTIDHVLPQGWRKNKKWEKQLLGNANLHSEKAIEADNMLHTIGNLTLLSAANNPRKSNRHFDESRPLLHDSSLKMNRDIAKRDQWDLQAIRKRGADLVTRIRRIWPHPDNA